MKLPLSFIFILCFLAFAESQVKDSLIYLDDNWVQCDSINATFYKEIIRETPTSDRGTIHYKRMNGTLSSTADYASLSEYKKHGYSKKYNENGTLTSLHYFEFGELNGSFYHYFDDGKLQIKGNYYRDELVDSLTTFYPNGILRRSDIYAAGKLINGNCFSSFGADTSYFPYEIPALFLGSTDSISRWISRNVNYPTEAIEMNEQGRVYVSFVIEKDGSVSTVRIERGVCQSLDNEVKRLINSMPNWSPAMQDGYALRTRVRLPVNFVLDQGGGIFSGERKKKWWKRN